MMTNPNNDAPRPLLSALDDYNWEEVFGEGTGGNCTPIIPSVPPGSKVSTVTFGRRDVEIIFGQQEGENDGPDWIVYGRLWDGRFFVARGGCDYTGWDCRASNGGNVAKTRNDLIRFGLSADERIRFGVAFPEDTSTAH